MPDIQTNLQIVIKAQNQTNAAFSQLNKDLSGLKTAVLTAAAAFVTGFALKNVIDSTNAWAQEVHNLNNEIGAGAETASRLLFVANTVGISADELQLTMGKLAKQMFSTSVEAEKGKDVFTKWGIALKDASGHTKNILDVLGEAGDKVKAMGNGAASTALELDLFAKSGGRLHDLLMLGSAGITEFIKKSDELGHTLTGPMLDALYNSIIAQNLFNEAISGFKIQLGAMLMPLLTSLVMNLTKLFAWINANIIHSQRFAGVIKVLGEAFRGFLGIMKQVLDRMVQFWNDIQAEGVQKAIEKLIKDIIQKAMEFLPKLGEELDKLGPVGWVIKIALLSAAVSLAAGAAGLIFGGVLEVLRLALLPITLTAGTGAFPFVLAITAGIALGLFVDRVTGEHGDKDLIKSFSDLNWWTRLLGVVVAGAAIGAGAPVVLTIAVMALLVFTIDTVLGQTPANKQIEMDGACKRALGPDAYWDGSKCVVGAGGGAGGGGGSGAGGGRHDSGAGDTSTGGPQMTQPNCGPGFTAVKWADGHWTCEVTVQGGRPMASGGIVTRPTMALVGESGPEAVIPLSHAGGLGGTVNVTVNWTGDVDSRERIKELADAIGQQLLQNLGHERSMGY